MIAMNMTDRELVTQVKYDLASGRAIPPELVRTVLDRFEPVADNEIYEHDLADANDELRELKSDYRDLENKCEELELSNRTLSKKYADLRVAYKEMCGAVRAMVTRYEEEKL